MKIAQIAPLYESVPPQAYGGTERVVHYLTEELVRQGHDVTLFASGDSRSSAQLVNGCAKALRLTNVLAPSESARAANCRRPTSTHTAPCLQTQIAPHCTECP